MIINFFCRKYLVIKLANFNENLALLRLVKNIILPRSILILNEN